MKSRSQKLVLSIAAALATVGVLLLITTSSTTRAGSNPVPSDQTGSGKPSATASSGSTQGSSTGGAAGSSLADKPLAAYQLELLDIAFDSATRFPVNPHVATRSQVQEAVVDACLELDQPRRALKYIEQIEDWRRGKGYADLAFYCAKHGDMDDVPHYLDLAYKTAQRWLKEETNQYWQIDRIKVAMARVHLLRGDTQAADRFEIGTADSEAEKVEVLKASMLTPDAFDHEFELIDKVVALGNFDMTKSALETCAQLFSRFYENAERRSLLEGKIKASWAKLPLQVRIDLMMEMVNGALDHQDNTKALALVSEAREMLESAPWHPEDRIPLLGKLAALRYRAGDKDAARGEIDEAAATFDAARESIQSFNRASALRPLAEAYQSMGDGKAALAMYKKAIDEGAVNPNARPRAVDLSATCCSMALHLVEPDADLRARLGQLRDGLVDPW
jgi:hypothetical protein